MQMANETIAQAAQWFDALAVETPPDARYWIQVKRIVPKHRERTEEFRSSKYFFFATPQGRAAAARQSVLCSRQGYDVYASVLPRSERDGVQAAVPSASWIWCDIDGGDEGEEGAWNLLRYAMQNPVMRDKTSLPQPHLIVASGGGLHVYHRTDNVCTFDQSDGGPHSREVFHKTLKRYSLLFPVGPEGSAHADASRADCATTFRVPGTVNQKPSREGAVVTIREYNAGAPAFPYVWWRTQLPPAPIVPKSNYTRREGDPTIPRSTQAMIHTPSPAGGTHAHKMKIAYALAHAGHSFEGIVMLLDTNDQISGKATLARHRDNESLTKTALRKCGAPQGSTARC